MPSLKTTYQTVFSSFNKRKTIPSLSSRAAVPVVFPFYHVVSDASLPHISHLYPYRNTKQFEQDLDWLLSAFEPLSAAQLNNNEFDAGKRYFVLSFDDGLREMFDVVAPLLNRKGIPALFFLNSAFVDNHDILFRYIVSLILDKTMNGNDKSLIMYIKEKKNLRIHNLKKYLLSLQFKDREWIREMAAAANVDVNAFLKEQQPYLTLAQAQSHQQAGHAIGAHSINHPEYRFISLQEQLDQTTQSVQFVQQNFHQPFNYFAFPFTDAGVSERFFESILQGTEPLVDSCFGTAGLSKIGHHRMQRIPMEKNNNSAESIIKNEYAYYLFKKMIGQ